MKTYDVYFELFGKKMKTSVNAISESKAKEIVQNRIIFHKVAENERDYKKEANYLMDNLLNILK